MRREGEGLGMSPLRGASGPASATADRCDAARLTEIRMVSQPCTRFEMSGGRRGVSCLAKSGDWAQPMCPRCTAVLLAREVERLLNGVA